MNTALKIVALVLVVAGVMALAFGGTFTFVETENIGPFTVQERESIRYPAWGGLGLIVLGAGLFFIAPRQRRTG